MLVSERKKGRETVLLLGYRRCVINVYFSSGYVIYMYASIDMPGAVYGMVGVVMSVLSPPYSLLSAPPSCLVSPPPPPPRSAPRRSTASTDAVRDLAEALTTGSLNVASNLGKLLQGLENGIESMVATHYKDIIVDIDTLSMVTGELAIATHQATASEEAEAAAEAAADEALSEPEEFLDEETEVMYASSTRMIDLSEGSRRGSTESVFSRGACVQM